jgi:hypothetical protein
MRRNDTHVPGPEFYYLDFAVRTAREDHYLGTQAADAERVVGRLEHCDFLWRRGKLIDMYTILQHGDYACPGQADSKDGCFVLKGYGGLLLCIVPYDDLMFVQPGEIGS